MSKNNTAVVVLAAGLGTRMKSSKPKVLHNIFDRPMLTYVLDAASGLRPSKIVTVINKSMDSAVKALGLPPLVSTALQKNQNGTAHALISALPSLKSFKGTLVIINGDTPLVTPATLKKFVSRHRKAGNYVSVLSFHASNPKGYGRIIRNPNNKNLPEGIVEEKDAGRDQKLISEVNSGVYAIESSALDMLKRIKKNAKKKEFYLTDIVGLSINGDHRTGVYPIGTEIEFIGVNSRNDLYFVHEIIRSRTIDSLLSKGVTFIDTSSAYISPDARIGKDTLIYPGVFIHGNTVIGKGCTIFPGSRIVDSTIRDGVVVKDSSLIESSVVGTCAQIGPMAHLRPGSAIGSGAMIGNFVEVKKSTIGKNTKAMHLTYIGDASVGSHANLGAGTITCNYDGKRKSPTVVGNNVFIGSDTQLVAPVTIGDGAYIGAGSTITKDVKPDTLAVSRTKQKNYPRLKGKKG
jgi:bifunctional UDP-N-acetylglucosamine pyrophosphorylase/glucosamine-1-phosphate N-acetyltransferase